jgi:hypothetical protein
VTIVATLEDRAAPGTPVNFESGSTVTFTLFPSTWEGVATNDTEVFETVPSNDFSFNSTDKDILNQTDSPIGATATVDLFAFDFGGQATITATGTAPGGSTVVSTITLPLDSDRDLLPDDWENTHSTAGFNPHNTHSFSTTLDDGQEDIDTSLNNSNVGDGFTNFREYRGVIKDLKSLDGSAVTYSHERLNPDQKDLFVRGDGYRNSTECRTTDDASEPAHCNNLDVLDFSVDYATVFGLPAGTPNAFEEAGIVVHDVTGMPSFSEAIEPPHIDILVVTNNTTETTTIAAYANGWTNHLGLRYYTWDTKGASYVGIFDTYNLNVVTGEQGTYTYHLNLMHYFHNRPYWDELSNPDVPGGGPLNDSYLGLLDPVDTVEDYRNENGIGPERFRGRSEDRWIENDRLDGDHMWPDWKDISLGAGTYRAGYNFSTFDCDGDGRVENPPLNDPAGLDPSGQDPGEYTAQQVPVHTILHEMGHGVGIADHTTDPLCLMYENSINWNRAGHFSDFAQGQIMIHNKTE